MLKLKAGAVLVLMACLSMPAFAQTPSDASVERFVTVSGLMENFTADFEAGFVPSAVSAFMLKLDNEYPRLEKAKRDKIQALVTKEMEEMSRQFLALNPEFEQKMRAFITETTKGIYTQSELEALTAFYATELGQSVAKKQSEFNCQLMVSAMPSLDQAMFNFSQETQARLKAKQLMQQVDEILAE